MNTTQEWMDTIGRVGASVEAQQVAMLAAMEAAMPAEIAALVDKDNKDLIELLVQFAGGRSDPRETVLRAKFYEHVKFEVLRRMVKP